MNRAQSIAIALVTTLSFHCGLGIAQDSNSLAHYVSHVPGKNRVIVLVHGFTGSSETTWKGSNGASFPDLLATDTRIRLANVFVASYETHWTHDNATIDDLAKVLLDELTTAGVIDEHQDLIFICHSLGGLIVERMLIEHPDLAAKTSLIQFYGTPHQGAFSEIANPIASFIAAFGNNRVIPELRAGSGNSVLVKLDTDWRDKHLSTVHRFCAIEAYSTRIAGLQNFSGLVVPYFSGAYGCDGNVPIDTVYSDHVNMVKLTGRTGKGNEAYLIFLRNYRDNPYYETKTMNDSARDFHQYLDVDCNHTNSSLDYQVTFALNPLYDEHLVSAQATLDNPSNIKDVNPNPPTVTGITGPTAHVQYGFNGLDNKPVSGCPGGGNATLTVHPVIQSRIPIPDGQ